MIPRDIERRYIEIDRGRSGKRPLDKIKNYSNCCVILSICFRSHDGPLSFHNVILNDKLNEPAIKIFTAIVTIIKVGTIRASCTPRIFFNTCIGNIIILIKKMLFIMCQRKRKINGNKETVHK